MGRLVPLFLLSACAASARPKALFYLTQSPRSVQSFIAHADKIDILAPTWYNVDAAGLVWGGPDPLVMETRDSYSDSYSEESESDKLWRWDGTSSEEGGSEHDCLWHMNDRLGHLYFQYFERSTPYGRVPLMDKVRLFCSCWPFLTFFFGIRRILGLFNPLLWVMTLFTQLTQKVWWGKPVQWPKPVSTALHNPVIITDEHSLHPTLSIISVLLI